MRALPGIPAPMHPCLRCGACCTQFRVAFHWMESDAVNPDGVPDELTETLAPHRLCMRGTYSEPVRCVALDARIGEYSRCTIHPRRPSVCREVEASWEFGRASSQCDRSRIAHGMPALTPADWRWRDAPANDNEQPDDTPDNPDQPTCPPLVA